MSHADHVETGITEIVLHDSDPFGSDPFEPMEQKVQELCINCKWNTDFHNRTHYESKVHIDYAMSNRGIWSIGNQWLLRDQPLKHSGKDATSVNYLKKRINIPLVPETWSWKDNETLFTMSRRVEGHTLSNIWSTLDPVEKHKYAKEVAEYIIQVRTLQSERMESADGEPLLDRSLTDDRDDKPYYIASTEEEWWAETLIPGLRKCGCTDAEIEELRARFPPCRPYTFTHGDLNAQNIIVNKGHVAAIIDWELSGFYPVWYEDFATLWLKNSEWARLLLDYLPFPGDPEYIGYIRAFQSIWSKQHKDMPVEGYWVERAPFCGCHTKKKIWEVSEDETSALTESISPG